MILLVWISFLLTFCKALSLLSYTRVLCQDPRAEGHLVMPQQIPGLGLVECVMFRKLPEGHYDIEVELEVAAVLSERYDAGDMTLREGQQEAKYKQLMTATTSLATQGKGAKMLLPAQPAKPSHEADAAGGGKDGEPAPNEDENADDDENEEEDWNQQASSGLIQLLGVAKTQHPKTATPKAGSVSAPATAAKTATKPSASPKPKGVPPGKTKTAIVPQPPVRATSLLPRPPPLGGRGGGAQALEVRSQAGIIDVQDSGEAAEEPRKGKGRGRKGKSARLPSDTDELLARDNYFEIIRKFDLLVNDISGNPWDSWLVLSKQSIHFDKVCGEWCVKVEKVWKDNFVCFRQ